MSSLHTKRGFLNLIYSKIILLVKSCQVELDKKGDKKGSGKAKLFIFNHLNTIFPPILALEVHFWGQN